MPDFEIAKPDGTFVENVNVNSFEELRAYKKQKYGDNPMIFRPAPLSTRKKFMFGAAEGLSGPAQLGYLAARSLGEGLNPDPTAPKGQEALRLGLAKGSESLDSARESVARAMGMPGAPDMNQPDAAVSAGRAAGGLAYGARTIAGLVGSAAGEAADYGIQSSGGGALARFAGSLVADAGLQQLTSGKNRAALSAVGTAVANRKGIRAYEKLKTLDIVDQGFGDALASAQSRARRMLKFNTEAWDKFDRSIEQGMNTNRTAFLPGGVAQVDPTNLYRQANYIWTSTPEESRKNLPAVVKSLVKRSASDLESSGARGAGAIDFIPGRGGKFAPIPLSDLRGFHKEINQLWEMAAHKNASPMLGAQAAKADELRGAIMEAYEGVLSSGVGPRGPLSTSQVGALQSALESSRQVGGEFDKLKKANADLASGIGFEPQKLLTNMLGSNARVDSPEIAADLFTVVARESGEKAARQQLGQAWIDFVVGPRAEFRLDQAIGRIRQSQKVGEIWAGPDRVKNLERILRDMGDKGAPPSIRNFAQSTLSFSLAAAAGSAASGNDMARVAAHGLAGAGAGAVPHVYLYIKDKFGPDAVRNMARELLMDRQKFLRMQEIATKTPSLRDFEWVDANVKALALRQSGRAARQLQSGEQQ